MAQNIFVSYNFADSKVQSKVKDMVYAWRQDLVGHIVHAEQGMIGNNAEEIRRQLNKILNQCDCVLFVLGDKFQNSPWLSYEVERARRKALPIFTTRIPGFLDRTPPQLEGTEFVKVRWNADELSACFSETFSLAV